MFASAGARVATLPLTAIASALTTYLIVGYAGAEMFGYVNLIATLFLLLPFADLGLGAAIVNKVASASSIHDDEGARALTRAAFLTLVMAAAGLIAIVGVAAAGGLLAQFVGLGDVEASAVNAAILVAIAPFAIALPFGVGQRVLLGLREESPRQLVFGHRTRHHACPHLGPDSVPQPAFVAGKRVFSWRPYFRSGRLCRRAPSQRMGPDISREAGAPRVTSGAVERRCAHDGHRNSGTDRSAERAPHPRQFRDCGGTG